jgi:hypothetical protein
MPVFALTPVYFCGRVSGKLRRALRSPCKVFMDMYQTLNRRAIEVRGFKWPERPTGVAVASLLGEDAFGRWLGITRGDPWWAADRSRSGVFEFSFVKLVPSGTFWTVCFHPVEPAVDVDIVLPVRWAGDVLEEVDLEVDILRTADGTVHVRDQDDFERVRKAWSMPDDIIAQVEATTEQIKALVEQHAEPFGEVGRGWLARWLAEVDATGR